MLDDEGRVLAGARVPDVSDEQLRRIFDVMSLIRIMDDRIAPAAPGPPRLLR
ncbi:MAG: hypothetical protein HS111_18090 [Kofleriaceae bacterium]|nr:hypothetical protein [Kofleriaceae bacterium]